MATEAGQDVPLGVRRAAFGQQGQCLQAPEGRAGEMVGAVARLAWRQDPAFRIRPDRVPGAARMGHQEPAQLGAMAPVGVEEGRPQPGRLRDGDGDAVQSPHLRLVARQQERAGIEESLRNARRLAELLRAAGALKLIERTLVK